MSGFPWSPAVTNKTEIFVDTHNGTRYNKLPKERLLIVMWEWAEAEFVIVIASSRLCLSQVTVAVAGRTSDRVSSLHIGVVPPPHTSVEMHN